jgi:hypothetical protein
MSKRKGPTKPSRVWGPWFIDPRSPFPNGDVLMGNGLFTVHVTMLNPTAGMEGPLQLAIHDKHRTTRHDWREFQRIKNEICGPEREAVELYPAESRLVDTANEYHLWVSASGESIEVGFRARAVADRDTTIDPTDPRVTEVAAGLGISGEALVGMIGKARQRKLDMEGSYR